MSVLRSLIRNGADPNTLDDNGDTPLLRAARTTREKDKCEVEIVKELIQGGADVGLVNKDGSCALLLAASNENVEMVQELLNAGGDPSVANKNGSFALLAAANYDNTELIRLLFSAAPTALNRTCQMDPGQHGTALYAAAGYGHEGTVEFLLGAGAKQPVFSGEEKAKCPLGAAVYFGHPGVVAILLRSKGLEAIGGVSRIPETMEIAVKGRRVRILQILLNMEGEDREHHWARSYTKCRTMLHWAVSVGNLATMSVLLAAGADETATTANSQGHSPYDYIAPCSCRTGERDPADEAARARMLDRGPAFRARSWAWPDTVWKEVVSAGLADGGVLVVWCRRAPKVPPWVGVRIYRPKPKKHHVRLLLAGDHKHHGGSRVSFPFVFGGVG